MRRRNRGFALAAALCMSSVLLVLGLAYGARTSVQLHETTRLTQSLQASYLAEAGVQYARRNIGQLKLPYQQTLQFETGTVTVTVADGDSGSHVIRAFASAGRVRRGLYVITNASENAVSQRTEVVL